VSEEPEQGAPTPEPAEPARPVDDHAAADEAPESAVDPALDPATMRRGMPRSARLPTALVLGGIVLVLLASTPTWVRVPLRITAGIKAGDVKLTGGDAAPVAVPLALVAAAGLLALALVRAWARRLLAVLIAAAGVGVTIAAIRVIADPGKVARGSSRVRSAGEIASTHLGAVPYVSVIGGAVIVAGAVVTAVVCGRWPAPTKRYERANQQASRPSDTWDALEKGDDPTSS